MQRHHQIGILAIIFFSNMYMMANTAQNPRPAIGGLAVSGFGPPRRRRYKNNPASMSFVQARQ